MRFRVQAADHEYKRTETDDKLQLRRQGGTGHVVLRTFVTLVLLVFASMPVAAMYFFSDQNIWAALLALPLFTVFPWFPMLGLFAWIMGEVMGSWREIVIDSGQQQVRGLRDGWFLWATRKTCIPFHCLKQVQIERRTSSQQDGQILLKFKYTQEGWWGPGEEDSWMSFQVPDLLTSRDRFLEFAFALARRLGWSGYRLRRDDHLQTTVRFHPTSEPSPVHPLPESPPSAEQSTDASDVRKASETDQEGFSKRMDEGEIPPRDLPSFDPEKLDGSFQAPAWEPGHWVKIHKEGMTVGKALWASIGGTILGNLPTLIIGWILFLGPAQNVWWLWKAFVAGMFVFVTFLLNAYIWTEGRTTRTVELDWQKGRARFSRNRRQVERSLGAIEGLWVQGIRNRGRGENSQDRYWCKVFVDTEDSFVMIAKTDSSPGPDQPYQTGARMAADLAQALEVDWEWRGWREHSLPKKMRDLTQRLWNRYGP